MQQAPNISGEGAPLHRRKRILFVGYGNSCRSQMAEAFARHYGMGLLDAFSAGLDPEERVTSQARAAMRARGIPLPALAQPKPLSIFDVASFDAIVFLTEFDIPVGAESVIKIQTPDTRRMNSAGLRRVRDEIEARVLEIVHELRPKAQYWPILLAYRDVHILAGV